MKKGPQGQVTKTRRGRPSRTQTQTSELIKNAITDEGAS